jgi:hypothetical protein
LVSVPIFALKPEQLYAACKPARVGRAWAGNVKLAGLVFIFLLKAIMKKLGLLAVVLALSACNNPAPATSGGTAPTVAATTPAASTAEPCKPAAPFIDRVWRVRESSAVARGTLYVFLSDGTLLVAADKQSPSFWRWTYENGALTMIEESVAYPTDILTLNDKEFTIRSHNPGESVLITLVPVVGVSLPE